MLNFKALKKINFSNMKSKDWKVILPFVILILSLLFKLYKKYKKDNTPLNKQILNINADGTPVEQFQSVIDDMYNIISTNGVIGFKNRESDYIKVADIDANNFSNTEEKIKALIIKIIPDDIDHNVQNFGFFLGGNNVSLMKKNERTNKRVYKNRATGKTEEIEKKEIFENILVKERKEGEVLKAYEIYLKKNNNEIKIQNIPVVYYGYGLYYENDLGDIVLVENSPNTYYDLNERSFMNITVDDNSIYTYEYYEKLLNNYVNNLSIIKDVEKVEKQVIEKIVSNVILKIREYAEYEGSQYIKISKPLQVKSLKFIDTQGGDILKGKIEPQSDGSLIVGGNDNNISINNSGSENSNITFDINTPKLQLGYGWNFTNDGSTLLINKEKTKYMRFNKSGGNVGMKMNKAHYKGDTGNNLVSENFENPVSFKSVTDNENPNILSYYTVIKKIDFDSEDKNFENNYIKLLQLDSLSQKQIITLDINPFDSKYITKIHVRITIGKGNISLQQFNYVQLSYENNELVENYKLFEKIVIMQENGKYNAYLKTTIPVINNMSIIFNYSKSTNGLIFLNSTDENNKFDIIEFKQQQLSGNKITETQPNNFTLVINKDGKDIVTKFDINTEKIKQNMSALQEEIDNRTDTDVINNLKTKIYEKIELKNPDNNYKYAYLNLVKENNNRDIILEDYLKIGNYKIEIEDDTGDFKISHLSKKKSFFKLSYSDHSVILYSNERNNSSHRQIFLRPKFKSNEGFSFQNMNWIHNDEHDCHFRIYSLNNNVLMDANRFGGVHFGNANRNALIPYRNNWVEGFQNETNDEITKLETDIKTLNNEIKNLEKTVNNNTKKRDDLNTKRKEAVDTGNQTDAINYQNQLNEIQKTINDLKSQISKKRDEVVNKNYEINDIKQQIRNETQSATGGSQADEIVDSTVGVCKLSEFYWSNENKNSATEVINLVQSYPIMIGKLSVSPDSDVSKMINIEFLPSKKNPTMENISMILSGNNISVVRYINIKSDKESKLKFFLRKDRETATYYLFVKSNVAQDMMIKYIFTNLEQTDFIENKYSAECIVKGTLDKYGNDLSNTIIKVFPEKKFNESEYSSKINDIKNSLLNSYCGTSEVQNINENTLKECKGFIYAEDEIISELGVGGNNIIKYDNDNGLKLNSNQKLIFRKNIKDYQNNTTTVIYRLSIKNNNNFSIECINPNFFGKNNVAKENKYGKTVIHGLDGKEGVLNRANISFSDSNNNITTTGFGGIIFNNWCYHSDTKSRLRLTYVNHLNLDERKHKEGKYAFRMTNIPNRRIEGRNNRQVHIEYDTDKVDKYFEKLIKNDYIMHLGPLRFRTFKDDKLVFLKNESKGELTFKQAKEMCDKNPDYIGFDIARENNGKYDTYMWKKTKDNENLPVIPDPILGNKLNNSGVRSFEKITRTNYEEPDTCSLNKLQLDRFMKKYEPKFVNAGSFSSNFPKNLNYTKHHDPLTVILDVSSNNYMEYHQGIFSKYGYDIGINLAYGYVVPYAGYTGFDNFKSSHWQKLPKLENDKQYTIAVSWNSQVENTKNRNNDDYNYKGKCRISVLVVEKNSGISQSYSYISNSVFGVSGDKKNTAPYNVGIQAAGPACNCNPFKGTISNIKIYHALLDTSCLRERQYSGYINGINIARDLKGDPAWTAPFKDLRYHFTTYYKPDESGTYKFTVNVDDNCQIFINESLIYSEEGLKPPTEKMDTEMNMQKNQLYKFDIYYAERHSGEVLEIKYKKPNDNTVYSFPYLNNMKEYSSEKDIDKKLFSGYPEKLKLGPTVRRIYKTYRIRYNVEGALNVAPSLGRPSGHSDGKFYWSQNEYPVGTTFIKKTSIDYPIGYDDAGEHALEQVSNKFEVYNKFNKFDIFSNYQLYDNVDFLGGDLPNKNFKTETEDICLKKCQENIQCNGLTYRKGDGHCWLKSLNGARRVDNRPDLKSYLKITNY